MNLDYEFIQLTWSNIIWLTHTVSTTCVSLKVLLFQAVTLVMLSNGHLTGFLGTLRTEVQTESMKTSQWICTDTSQVYLWGLSPKSNKIQITTKKMCAFMFKEQLLTWLHLSYEQDLLRSTSFFLHFLWNTCMMNKNDLNEPQKLLDNKSKGHCLSFLNCPTFLARIRATRRDISDGHQFSSNAVIAEHSNLCMAQSPF